MPCGLPGARRNRAVAASDDQRARAVSEERTSSGDLRTLALLLLGKLRLSSLEILAPGVDLELMLSLHLVRLALDLNNSQGRIAHKMKRAHLCQRRRPAFVLVVDEVHAPRKRVVAGVAVDRDTMRGATVSGMEVGQFSNDEVEGLASGLPGIGERLDVGVEVFVKRRELLRRQFDLVTGPVTGSVAKLELCTSKSAWHDEGSANAPK